ncbi:MAG: hypothetical protein ABJF01_24360, partial [bacterium]
MPGADAMVCFQPCATRKSPTARRLPPNVIVPPKDTTLTPPVVVGTARAPAEVGCELAGVHV